MANQSYEKHYSMSQHAGNILYIWLCYYGIVLILISHHNSEYLFFDTLKHQYTDPSTPGGLTLMPVFFAHVTDFTSLIKLRNLAPAPSQPPQEKSNSLGPIFISVLPNPNCSIFGVFPANATPSGMNGTTYKTHQNAAHETGRGVSVHQYAASLLNICPIRWKVSVCGWHCD